MKLSKVKMSCALAVAGIAISTASLKAQSKLLPQYHIYSGNTHSHTAFTRSHGAQFKHLPGFKKFLFIDSNSVGHSINTELKPDWQKLQGPPSAHFAEAKADGYDFYVTTDHSQEAGFNPPSPSSPDWIAAHKEASAATDKNFVAISGYEHSENNGPVGKGHLNIINSASYLNALKPGVDIPYLYKWLDTVSSFGNGPVVASFNHPGAHQYDDWAYRDPKVTNIITMLEVINSNSHIHYQGFVNALDAGWKVSPVCGNDNHGLNGIRVQKSRTFVLATSKTKAAILDAMKNRRTYASLDNNIQCKYSVNGMVMGSTLNKPKAFKFRISISDPDTNDPNDKITKIDIVKDSGKIVQTYTPTPGYSVEWNPVIKDADAKFFFVRVWNAGGGDAPRANADRPIAWLAPVWTGK